MVIRRPRAAMAWASLTVVDAVFSDCLHHLVDGGKGAGLMGCPFLQQQRVHFNEFLIGRFGKCLHFANSGKHLF